MGDLTIAVYGLGKLGLPLASVLHDAGYNVTGVDLEDKYVECASTGVAYSRTPVDSSVSFIVVPTPSNDDGSFSSEWVENALRGIDSDLVVLVSTVSPGTCDELAKQLRPGQSLVYNPTFIALGSVVSDLISPNMLLIGGDSSFAASVVVNIWSNVFAKLGTDADWSVFHFGSYVEIELLKISVNAALATKISLANSLGQLFAAYGVDRSAVAELGRDPRLGKGYFTPGSPIAGPCLPRDNRALRTAAAAKSIVLPISEATDTIDSDLRRSVLYEVCRPRIPKTVGILGMSYKPGVAVETDSMGAWLKRQMSFFDGVETKCWDYSMVYDDLVDVLASDVVVLSQSEYESTIKDISEETKVIKVWEC